MRFLVTAGNTREKIDRVRDWGNIFTGNTGYSIARAISALGEVDLITSNRVHLAEVVQGRGDANVIRGTGFTSHAELKSAIESALRQNTYDAIFMSAAVADYRPAGSFQIIRREVRKDDDETWIVRNVQAGKIKSSYEQIAILGERTEKLVDLFRGVWGYRGMLVKFKLEVGIPPEKLIEIGHASRKASGASYLVANTLEMVDGDRAGAYLLSGAGEEWVPRAELAARMARLVRDEIRSGS
jgi:phosphopantothenoylcysteine synthetase/decarboxylase